MTNRLASETSPYLRQHAENPVDWYPWGDEAFAAARERDVPVLLSVGYSSCHWCHVMAHESFEDPATAEVMNRDFVNVKVDREERPDVDAVYMEATQAMTGQGGWPMTVFMTPEGEPFYCGTYFPAEARGAGPTFTQLLAAIAHAWTEERDQVTEQAGRLVGSLRRPAAVPGDGDLPGVEVLDEATMGMLAAHDAARGGFGRAPKFPQAMSLGHLLRHHARTGSSTALAAVTSSLDAMASGGIYDHLGGGFSRYSVDEHWLVPHFEKMLYDNALLARTYLHSWQVTGAAHHLQVVEETIGYVLAELSHPEGGRYSAEDADSLPPGAAPGAHPEEGAFYVWSPEQVAEALDEAGLADSVDATLGWYGIRPGGNFEGASIPNRLHAPGQLERPEQIEAARAALHAARAERPRPGLDDKVLTEWNGLLLAALAEAAAATGRTVWLQQAEATGRFLCERLRREDGRWMRSWQEDGGAQHLAYASDHGALIDGFLCLYEATGRRRWLDEAVATAEALLELFWDPEGGVWTTGEDAEELVTRPKDLSDGATPSANSTAAIGLLRLEAHTGEHRYGEHARQILRRLGSLAAQHPLAFGHLLWAIGLQALGVTEVVVTGERRDLVEVVQRGFAPHTVLAWGEPGEGPLWEGRDETGPEGRAYVCRNRACGAPVTSPEALAAAFTAGTR
jgi:uncharacterized protein YyaL (SSP411 family)